MAKILGGISSGRNALVFGAILLVIGTVVLALALWRSFGLGEDATDLFIAAPLFLMTASLVFRSPGKGGAGDARLNDHA